MSKSESISPDKVEPVVQESGKKRDRSSSVSSEKHKRNRSRDPEKKKKKKHRREKHHDVDGHAHSEGHTDDSRSPSKERMKRRESPRRYSPDPRRSRSRDRVRRRESPRRSRSRERVRRRDSPRRAASRERVRRRESPRRHSPDRRSRSRDRVRRRESPRRHSPERRSRSRDRARRRDSPRRYSPEPPRRRSRERLRKQESPKRHSPPEPRRSKSKEKERKKETSRSPRRHSPKSERFISPEERDERTVSVFNLALRTSKKDLKEFFTSVGKVYRVRLLTDPKSQRHKGIAFIEFETPNAVPKALELDGQVLHGQEIKVRLIVSDRNRPGSYSGKYDISTRPTKLFVSNLHPNITEDVLEGIFEPFGRLENLELVKDERGQCKGFCYVKYTNPDHAKRAQEKMDGYIVAERELKVAFLSEAVGDEPSLLPAGMLDDEEVDRGGVNLGASARLQLMAKLAQGRGLDVPKSASVQLGATAQPAMQPLCPTFLLSNAFDPDTDPRPNWAFAVYHDVVTRCRPLGGAVHVYVDKTSKQGHVYVKAASQSVAGPIVAQFHGRQLGDRLVSVSYLTPDNYHLLFPDARYATTIL